MADRQGPRLGVRAAVLGLLGLALVVGGAIVLTRSGPDDNVDRGVDAAIARMRRIADDLCACRDQPCAELVLRQMATMREPGSKPSKAQVELAMTIADKMAACQQRIMTAPPAAPPP